MTQRYYGSKLVTAWEATSSGQPGYSVKYEDGYTSWSPKETFEKAYLPLGHTDSLPGWQERIVAEFVQLSDRLAKLNAYLDAQVENRTIDEALFALLEEQGQIMAKYLDILVLRLKIHGVTQVWSKPDPQ